MWQKFFEIGEISGENTIFRICLGAMHEKQCFRRCKVHIAQPEGYARCRMQSRIQNF